MDASRAQTRRVRDALHAIPACTALRVRARGTAIYVEAKGTKWFPHLRLRRIGEDLWQREQLGGRLAQPEWVAKGGRISLERQLRRFLDPKTLRRELFVDVSTTRGKPALAPLAPDVLPRLVWQNDGWTGSVVLESWRGFACRFGPEGERIRAQSRPCLSLNVAVADGRAPSQAQRRAFAYIKANERAVTAAVLRALFAAYRRDRSWMLSAADDSDPEIAAMLAPLATSGGLRDRVSPGVLHILPVEHAGVAYSGLELGCVWAQEHGLGVLLHGRRVVEVGDASTAFGEESAKRDAKKQRTRGSGAPSR